MSISSTSVMPGLGQLVSMTRPGLTGMVAFSAVVGYLATAGHHAWSVTLILWAGIALLSGTASILNQVQEREVDACMDRTRLRPLVTGTMTVGNALLLAAGCGLTGLLLLTAVSAQTVLAALLALLLYNGLYTPLKRYSSLALFPGALSGALPVAAGWLAVSGPIDNSHLFSLLIFMILWQVPHFICMAICERNEYHKAGLALVPDSVSTVQLVQLTRLWTAALGVGSLQLIAIGFLPMPLTAYSAIVTVLWLMFQTLLPFRVSSPERFAIAQGKRLKLFLGLFLLLILFDSVLI